MLHLHSNNVYIVRSNFNDLRFSQSLHKQQKKFHSITKKCVMIAKRESKLLANKFFWEAHEKQGRQVFNF